MGFPHGKGQVLLSLSDTQVHFPATANMVMRYMSIFGSFSTMQQYLKHLRWAHRFLHLDSTWETSSVKQCMNGLRKSSAPRRLKSSILSSAVRRVVLAAEAVNDLETAALAAVSRLFLLRVPSEGIPLEWDGEHSKVELFENSATITLMRRKNRAFPTSVERCCCCETSTAALCAIHWLARLRAISKDGRVFHMSTKFFVARVRFYATESKLPGANNLTSHAFRRGMAQDIVDNGGSLAVLLRAGDWHSRAFFLYLRDSQVQDSAVANIVVNASDSEDETPV